MGSSLRELARLEAERDGRDEETRQRTEFGNSDFGLRIGEGRGQRVRGQRSEVRSQRTEVRGQRTEFGN